MALQFPPTIIPDLTAAGWKPGRSVSVSDLQFDEFRMFPAAEEVLREMRGLVIPARPHGKDHASTPLNFDPALPADYTQCVDGLVKRAGGEVFPLAEGGGGYDQYFIDTRRRVFCYSTLAGDYFLESESFERAIENLILGIDERKPLP